LLIAGTDPRQRRRVIQPSLVIVDPFEGIRRRVGCLKSKHKKLVELGRRFKSQAALCFRSFLNGMQEARLAGRRKGPVTLISHGVIGAIDSNHGNADRTSPASFELNHLVPKVVDHAVDLLDHCRQDFDLDTDFDGSDRASRHQVARVADGRLAWDDLAKGPVAPPRGNAAPLILSVQNALLAVDCRVDQLR
jgi:hypothetical protein